MSELDRAKLDYACEPIELRYHAENPVTEDGRIHVTPELLFAIADRIDDLRAELARRDELIKHKEEVIGHIKVREKTVFELLSNTIKRRNKKIAEQADIIARLKEDGERLAVLENAYGTKRINALNLHKQLMKELEC